MAVVFRWVPKNLTDSLMRAIVKNESTGRKIKEAIAKKLMEEGEYGLDVDGAIKIDANPDFIRVIVDRSGSAASAVNEVDLDDLVPEFNVEEFLFGKEQKIDDADEGPEDALKQYDQDIKDIIEEVVKGVAPLESI